MKENRKMKTVRKINMVEKQKLTSCREFSTFRKRYSEKKWKRWSREVLKMIFFRYFQKRMWKDHQMLKMKMTTNVPPLHTNKITSRSQSWSQLGFCKSEMKTEKLPEKENFFKQCLKLKCFTKKQSWKWIIEKKAFTAEWKQFNEMKHLEHHEI